MEVYFNLQKNDGRKIYSVSCRYYFESAAGTGTNSSSAGSYDEDKRGFFEARENYRNELRILSNQISNSPYLSETSCS